MLKQERQARRELTRELDELIDNQSWASRNNGTAKSRFITSGASASAWHLSPMKARQLLRRSWQAVPSNLRQRHCQTREDDLRAEVADDRRDIFHQGHEHMPARWVVVADLDYFHWALLITGNFLREVVFHVTLSKPLEASTGTLATAA